MTDVAHPEAVPREDPASEVEEAPRVRGEAEMGSEVASEVASDPAPTAPGEAARAVASRTALAAQAAVEGVRGGIRQAGRRLDDERAAWDRATDRAVLPDLERDDPMASLAIRLDREADFWRAFAIDRMRPGASRALALGAAVIGLAGGAGLAAMGALGELLGAATAAHLWAASGALGTGVLGALACSAWLDRAASRARDEALLRSDAAERKLQRVAAILALGKAGAADAHRDALLRL